MPRLSQFQDSKEERQWLSEGGEVLRGEQSGVSLGVGPDSVGKASQPEEEAAGLAISGAQRAGQQRTDSPSGWRPPGTHAACKEDRETSAQPLGRQTAGLLSPGLGIAGKPPGA